MTNRKTLRGLVILALFVTGAMLLSGCGPETSTPASRLDALQKAIRRQSVSGACNCYSYPVTIFSEGDTFPYSRDDMSHYYENMFALPYYWNTFEIVNRIIGTTGDAAVAACRFLVDCAEGRAYRDVGFEMQNINGTWLIVTEIDIESSDAGAAGLPAPTDFVRWSVSR